MSAFSITGEFAGYVRLANGKRRLLLRTLDQELLFKVPKELRQELDGMLPIGITITLHGEEEEGDDHHRRLVVSSVHLEQPPRPGACIVRVCGKKNCWKAGGRDLAHHLEKRLESAGLDKIVRLKISGCLDHCKHAPVIACNEHIMVDSDETTVRELVARLRGRFLPE